MNRTKMTMLNLMMIGAFMATGAMAQNEQHEQHQGAAPTPAPSAAPMACCAGAGMGMPGSEAKPGGMAGAMSCPHQQAAVIADQLLTSFAELEKATDMAALKLKLASHGALLKQLKTATEASCPMMGSGMSGPMSGMKH
jgi:hypothetical protein